MTVLTLRNWSSYGPAEFNDIHIRSGMDADASQNDSPFPVTGPLVTVPAEPQFCCPGETHSISRSVHLSRLAAFFPPCRQCEHRHDTGQLTPQTVERIQQVEHRVPQPTLFNRDGVRGVFLNELTASAAGHIAGAFASLLWERAPLAASNGHRHGQPARRGPTVVVGYDERPSSPAVLSSVTDTLRLMDCPVTDVGLVSRPCFAFAVDHVQAAGGIFVTGSGGDASWTGLDLVGESATPLSADTGLEIVEQRLTAGFTRPTRRAAFQQSFQALVPYETGLWKHFHALRPLRVVCAARPRPVRRTLRRLFARIPCELFEVPTDAGVNAPVRPEVLQKRISELVTKKQAHLGLLIDDDGARCIFTNERGLRIDSIRLSAFLANVIRSEQPHAKIVVENPAAESFSTLTGMTELIGGGESPGRISLAMRKSNARFGGGNSDRYWFRESFPACDAILTLARVLQGLSRSDAPFSVAVGSART